jgi:hypothetical protein
MNGQDLENIWDALLSRDAEQVRSAYNSLGPTERDQVLAHLLKMTSEEGWHPQQRESARAALAAIQDTTGS